MSTLSGQQVADAALTGWTNLAGRLVTRVRTGSFRAGLALVDAIGAAAEEQGHHPDLDLRYPHVDVTLRSHDAQGVTERDVRLARTVTALALGAGHALDPLAVQRVEIALDSPERGDVMPFWAALLRYEVTADDEVGDPAGAAPPIWFQQSGREEPRQRWHFDVWVDPAQVQPRIDDAVAAGGTVVDDAQAPSFWVLADPEGNRVCLCTWQSREG